MCCGSVLAGNTKQALDVIVSLWDAGYAATDIIQTLFKVSVWSRGSFDCTWLMCVYVIQVTKGHDNLSEPLKLTFIREIGNDAVLR